MSLIPVSKNLYEQFAFDEWKRLRPIFNVVFSNVYSTHLRQGFEKDLNIFVRL